MKNDNQKKRLFRWCSIFMPLLIITTIAKAQSPGGIASPEVWLKVTPVTDNIQGNYRWQDYGGDSVKFNQYSAQGGNSGTECTQALNYIRTYNFNPALDMDDANGRELWLPKTNLAQCTIIGVWGSDYGNFDQDMYMYVVNGRPGEGVLMSKNLILESRESGKSLLDYGSSNGMDMMYHSGLSSEKNVNKFRERALRVHSYYRLNKPYYRDVWGERQTAVISPSNVYNTTDVNNNSSFDLTQLANNTFWGFVPEMVIYSRLLTPLERMRVESYLALKYGFSLTASYISSKNRLIWDYAANKSYNTRITGIYRDSISGLYQSESTTSYEESPYYSDLSAYDTYDGNNLTLRSSRYRLLVMGRAYGTNMDDGNYTIWGDDDQSFTIPTTGVRVIGGLTTMNRNWKVCTSVQLPPNSAGAQDGLWTYSGLQMSSGISSSAIIKESTDTAVTGTAVTTTKLSGLNGYFGWIFAAAPAGGITIKFGTQNPVITSGANDYGYYIGNGGYIYPIIAGKQSSTSVALVYNNYRIEIEKKGNKVRLRVNNSWLPAADISVLPTDSLKDYYGTLKLDKGTGIIYLTKFTANGFYYGNGDYKSNGGHRLELSYDGSRATNFSPYYNGQTYLIIDRSGTGTYPADATDYYLNDDYDVNRTKIIFNNIQWDTDGNGSDVFTFGYLQAGKLAVSTDSINPSCLNGIANNDGVINIRLLSGLKGINYTLVNTADTGIRRSGRFFTDNLWIDSLPAGSYRITMTEIGGYDFQSTSASTFRPSAYSATYAVANTNCSVNFLAGTKDSGAAVGFMMLPGGVYTIPSSGIGLPDYGVMKKNGELYLITASSPVPSATVQSVGAVSLYPIAEGIQVGDSISIALNSGKLVISVNGATVSSATVPASDLAFYYRGSVTLPANLAGSEVCNVNFVNITTVGNTACPTSDNMTASVSAKASTTATATLSADCTAPTTSVTATAASLNNPLSVYYKNTGNMMNFTAKVSLTDPGNSQILVFNMSGTLVYQTMLNGNAKVQTADITVLTPGVYIVKAITPEGEFSQEVLGR